VIDYNDKQHRWQKTVTEKLYTTVSVIIEANIKAQTEYICNIIRAFEFDSLGKTECKIACQHTDHKLSDKLQMLCFTTKATAPTEVRPTALA